MKKFIVLYIDDTVSLFTETRKTGNSSHLGKEKWKISILELKVDLSEKSSSEKVKVTPSLFYDAGGPFYSH